MREEKRPFRAWLYAERGDYHRNLDPNWSYTPTYLRKMAFVRQFMMSVPQDSKILDVGCGEGVLVEELSQKGWEIEGIDLNYESKFVRRGDVLDLSYADGSFDLVLFLDTLEHLAYEEQPRALAEIKRILQPGGHLIMSVPNLAHLNSRVGFILFGKLDRPDRETDHIGERPNKEYEEMLKKSSFTVEETIGITFSVPFLYRRVICRNPAKFRWLHDSLEPLARLFPSLAMLAIFVCRRGGD